MLRFKLTPRAAETHVLIYGEINELAGFDELTLSGRVALDFAGVTLVNSTGARELVSFLERLRRSSVIAEAERCPPALVARLNLVPGLFRRIPIRSVLIPVECPRCLQETEESVAVTPGRLPDLPTFPCDDCGAPMSLAEPAERYFRFLLA